MTTIIQKGTASIPKTIVTHKNDKAFQIKSHFQIEELCNKLQQVFENENLPAVLCSFATRPADLVVIPEERPITRKPNKIEPVDSELLRVISPTRIQIRI